MKNTVSIENIDKNGFWININKKRIYAPFDKFKLFTNVKVNDIFDVSYLPGDVLHWEKADIDICKDAFIHPDKYIQIFDAYPGMNEKETQNTADENITQNKINASESNSTSKKIRIAREIIFLAKELIEDTSEE